MLTSRGRKHIRKMSSQGTRSQQMSKIRQTTLGFGVVQILLGISLTSLSFTAFTFTSSNRIRNACPYWAGFTVLCSGGVGLIAWKNSTVMSMSLFTFFSAVCVVLQMIGTLLTGDAGGHLKSLLMCEKLVSSEICKCCDSVNACQHSSVGIEFEGVSDCSLLTGLLTGLMYGLFVLTIFGSILCFVATILGCTAVARETGRNQGLCSRHSSRRSECSHDHDDRYTWVSYPTGTDLTMLPPYAPPVYHSIENIPDYGLSSCIVPPPVFDPTDLPPPYSSQNPSLADSQTSLSSPADSSNQIPIGQEITESHTIFQSPIHDNHETTTRNDDFIPPLGTPSGVVHFTDGDLQWNKENKGDSKSLEIILATSNPSCSCNGMSSKDLSDQQSLPRDDKELDSRRTARNGTKGNDAFGSYHASCSTLRLQRDVCENVPENARARASSLGTTVSGSRVTQVSIHPATPSLSSPCRRFTISSLAKCNKLGENSIYLNSFEVLSKPPPNVRVPTDESQTCSTAALEKKINKTATKIMLDGKAQIHREKTEANKEASKVCK